MIHTHALIIPTVLIPLAAVSVGISAVATYIAGLFGVTLKAEGPKKLLEVLVKPRVLVTAVLIQLAGMGAWKGYQYFKNYPAFLNTIEKKEAQIAVSSQKNYENAQSGQVRHFFEPKWGGAAPSPFTLKLKLQNKMSPKVDLGPFVGGVASAGQIFYGFDDGFVYELSQSDAQVTRKFFLGTMATPGAVIFNGHLFAGEGSHDTHHARVYQFDLKTGLYEKSFQTKGHTEGNPLVYSDQEKMTPRLFVPAGADGLYALDPETLEEKWHINEGHTDSGVLVVGNLVFNGTGREKGDSEKNRSYALAIDFNSGAIKWKHELPASSWMTPIDHDNEVCFPFGEVYFKSEIGGVACFDQVSGKPGMFYHQGAPIVSEMISLSGDLIFSDGSGRVCRVNHQIGRSLWCTQAGEAKNGKAFPGVEYDSFRNVLVYASKSSGLFILKPSDGSILAHWDPAKEEGEWGTNFASATVSEAGYWIANDSGLVRLVAPESNPRLNPSHARNGK